MPGSGLSRIRPQVVIPPRPLDGNSAIASSILDVRGYESVEFLCTGGAWTIGGGVSVLIEHGEQSNLSDAVPVPDAVLIHRVGPNATVDAANEVGQIGYRIGTGKRYVRVTITPTGMLSGFAPVIRRCYDPQLWVLSTSQVFSEIVDTLGYTFCSFPIAVGTGLGAKWSITPEVQYGDQSNLSDAAAVPDALLDALESTAMFNGTTSNVVRRIGYYAGAPLAKRYVRLRFPQSNGNGTMTAEFSAVAELSNVPLTAGFSVLGLFYSARTIDGAL